MTFKELEIGDFFVLLDDRSALMRKADACNRETMLTGQLLPISLHEEVKKVIFKIEFLVRYFQL